MGSLKGKVAFITGASSGIGAALAREFARRGANVALAARRTDRLEALAEEIRQAAAGSRVLVCSCDVNDEGSVEKAVRLAAEQLGKIDVVVANAGFGVVGPLEDLSFDDYRRQFETNVYGVLRTLKASLPFLKQSRGRAAVVGSVNGYLALAGNSPYAMSKFAVRALCDSLRGEWRRYGVSVTHVAPGFVESEIRQVDNLGVWHPTSSDRVPAWIQMSAARASRKIVSAVMRGSAEAVITRHGKAIVCMTRHTPRLVRFLIRCFGVTARPEPRQT